MALSGKLKNYLLAQATGNNGAAEALIDRRQADEVSQQLADRIDVLGAMLEGHIARTEQIVTALNTLSGLTDVVAAEGTPKTEYTDADDKAFTAIA